MFDAPSRVSLLCDQMRLSPYQSYILEKNSHKYDLSRLTKRGDVLYAPYRHDDRDTIANYTARILFGPRADLIGPDRMLANDRRGIKVNSNRFKNIAR